MKKKIFVVTLLFIIVCLMFAVVGCSFDDNEYFIYELNEDNASYTVTVAEPNNVKLKGGTVTIPSEYKGLPITSIGDGAFSRCSSLTSIEIPDSVTSIGSNAFNFCSSLTSIEIPDSVISIGSNAFNFCISLTSIEIPDSVTSIGPSAFRDCSSLTSIEIPSSVASIGSGVLLDCNIMAVYCETESQPSGWDSNWRNLDNFSDLTVPVVWDCKNNYIASDGYIYCIAGGLRYALKDGKAKIVRQSESISGEIIIQSEVTYKGTVYSVTSIGEYAFLWCIRLTSIEIPRSVTSFGDSAFSRCSSLTSIEIPDSVISIGNSAFYGCGSLTIYCEASSQPSGWDINWNELDYNNNKVPIVWKHKIGG